MQLLYHIGLPFMLLSLCTGCTGQSSNVSRPAPASTQQTTPVGGGCDGCDIMYTGMPAEIAPVDTSAGWKEEGQKLLVTGTIYKLDGKTPAPGVILYYYHTDHTGYYSKRNDKPENGTVHGHIRGWVKTDVKGHYSFYTIRPAPYPGNNIPTHIHLIIKEPGINEYYIDELLFDDDVLLTGAKCKTLENRGGSGILRVLINDDLQIAEHNIILGLNIPNYPEKVETNTRSGLSIGEDNPSFSPFHAWGPDKGTQTCPVCKYGRYHGVIYFVGNHPQWSDIKQWLAYLEQESIARNKYLKAYFVYGNTNSYNKEHRQQELERIGEDLHLKNIALTFVPSFSDIESEVYLNKINPEVANTFVIYRHRNIIDKFVDLTPTADNFKLLSGILDKTTNNYFSLPEPAHN